VHTKVEKAAKNTCVGTLAGLRVIELAGARGAYCGKLLADLGADVIKIEPPGGCATRTLAPLASDVSLSPASRSLFFLYMNTNKRSLALDLAHSEGRAIFDRLLAIADVLIESVGPDTRKLLGLTDDRVTEKHERLIHISISVFCRN